MNEKSRPWFKSPRASHQGLSATYRTVGRWADIAARTALNQDEQGLAHAREKLHEAIIVAHERMGLPDRFGGQPPSGTLLEQYSRERLQQLTSHEIFTILNTGLSNDPLAELMFTRELIRRGDLDDHVPDEDDDALLLVGNPTPPTGLVADNETPWRGKDRYVTAGRNGYPATYGEILTTYAAGGKACDNNTNINNCPHQTTPNYTSAQSEKANFLSGVWRAGWRFRRSQILAAQLAAGHGDRFADGT